MPLGHISAARGALSHRRTKIVATLGPSSSSSEKLGALIDAGVNVFRLNFSHGTHESHSELYRKIRATAEEKNSHVAILADLCGPKIRCGRFADGSILLTAGDTVTITTRDVLGAPGLIPSLYKALADDVTPGDRILLDDGKLELSVTSTSEHDVICSVVCGGRLSDRKGINLPGVNISTPSLTEKDRDDARLAAKLGVDFMALSFVRSAKDILDLRELLLQEGRPNIPIISKIEKPDAVENIASILGATDGVMIARGDLGVELPAEEVPLIQQSLIKLAVEANRPVIVATQMLESMIDNARPTRAEVNDVAVAAMAGADAVMLSGETAAGLHPVGAVETMDRVLRLVEGYQWTQSKFGELVQHNELSTSESTMTLQLSEALSRATAQLSRELTVLAIVVPSNTGLTARMISHERPQAPIIAASADPAVCRRLNLHWGVTPHQSSADNLKDIKHSSRLASALVHSMGLNQKSRFILLVHGENPTNPEDPSNISLLMCQ